MSMGSDCDLDDFERRIHVAGAHAMRLEAARIRANLCASRGLTPSQACNVGCETCGVIDASPSRCEQCTGAHQQNHFVDANKKVRMTDDGFLVDGEGSEL